MKKLESSLLNMVLVLTLISVIAGGALAYVNKVTEEPIAAINAKNLNDGIKMVVLGTTDGELEMGPVVTITDSATQKVQAVIYNTDKGVAVQSSVNGFGGELKVLVGFDDEGTIKGYTILATQETPGLGAKADTWFQEGGKGCIVGKNPADCNLTVSKDGGDIDAITASTITSKAFLNAVQAAYNAYKGIEKTETKADGATGATEQN